MRLAVSMSCISNDRNKSDGRATACQRNKMLPETHDDNLNKTYVLSSPTMHAFI